MFYATTYKSYLKIKSHLKNKLCCPYSLPHTPRPPLPLPQQAWPAVSGFALNGPSAAPLLSPKVNPLTSLPQPRTHGVVLSLPRPSWRPGGASSRRVSAERGRGGGGGKGRELQPRVSLCSAVKLFTVARPWQGPQWRRPQGFNSSLSSNISFIRTTTDYRQQQHGFCDIQKLFATAGECIRAGSSYIFGFPLEYICWAETDIIGTYNTQSFVWY